ncbi:MAG: hypothetical protein HYV09_24095 [Deltaproteobacteria bacterium]|nr:hypothetical protein [Deltaproteobacteria bacterium]
MTAAVSTLRSVAHLPRPAPASGWQPTLHGPPLLPQGGDLRTLLAELKVRDREQSTRDAESGVAIQEVVREAAADRARLALEQAKAAQKEGGFWSSLGKTMSTIATVAAVVAAAASVVCSGGASAPAILALAGTLLSAGSPLIAKAAGDDAGKVALYGGIALSLAGAGASVLGKTAATQAAKAAATQTAKTAAAHAAHAAKTAAAQAANPTLRAIGTATVVAARTTEGGARITEGFAKVREKHYEAAAERSNADAIAHRAEVRRSQAQVEELVESLRELDASVSRAMQTLAKVGEDEHLTRQQIVSNFRRA